MNIIIKERAIKDAGMNLETFLYLLLVKIGADVHAIEEECLQKQYITRGLYGPIVYHEIGEKLNSIMLNEDPEIPEADEILKLALELQKMYPAGYIEGVTGNKTYYKGNRTNIKNNLQKFFKIYNEDRIATGEPPWTLEDVKKATQVYIDSFNGSTTYLKTLPYFIIKQNKNGVNESILATILERIEAGEDIDNSCDIGRMI